MADPRWQMNPRPASASNDEQPAAPIYAFDITLLRRGDGTPGPVYGDDRGRWPTLDVPRDQLVVPMAVQFDDAMSRLAALERMFVEPDGSFVWVSPRSDSTWQVDGNAFERDGRVLLVDLKGSCPPEEFDRLLAAVGWPHEPMMMQLVRAAVLLDEQTFRQHAAARGAAGDGKTLRPG